MLGFRSALLTFGSASFWDGLAGVIDDIVVAVVVVVEFASALDLVIPLCFFFLLNS